VLRNRKKNCPETSSTKISFVSSATEEPCLRKRNIPHNTYGKKSKPRTFLGNAGGQESKSLASYNSGTSFGCLTKTRAARRNARHEARSPKAQQLAWKLLRLLVRCWRVARRSFASLNRAQSANPAPFSEKHAAITSNANDADVASTWAAPQRKDEKRRLVNDGSDFRRIVADERQVQQLSTAERVLVSGDGQL